MRTNRIALIGAKGEKASRITAAGIVEPVGLWQKILICGLLVALFSFVGMYLSACSHTEKPPTALQGEETSDASNAVSEDSKKPQYEPSVSSSTEVSFEALLYADPELNMLVTIKNEQWEYYKDRSTGQVYFYNAVEQDANSLISISAYEASGNAQTLIHSLWTSMKVQYDSLGAVYADVQPIRVGKDFVGVSYPFKIKDASTTISCTCVLWEAGDRVYLCTVSADEAHEKEVYEVLEKMLDSFQLSK